MPQIIEFTDLSASKAADGLRANLFTVGEYHEELIKRFESSLKYSYAMEKGFTTEQLRESLTAADAARRLERHAGLASPKKMLHTKPVYDSTAPLFSIPFVVSSAFDVSGHATTAGNDALEANIPQKDAAVVAKLREAGGVLFGVTNTHELNLGMTSRHHKNGTVKNPFSATAIAGGANGGAAAAVSGRFCPFAIGVDTVGDVRVPAALCGAVGFRPSLERYSRDGVISLSSTLDSVGIIARSVGDVRLVDGVLTGTGPDASCAGLDLSVVRVGIDRKLLFSGLSPSEDAVIQAQLRRMEEAGITFVDVDIAANYAMRTPLGASLTAALNECVSTIRAYEAVREYAAYASTHETIPPRKPKKEDEEEEAEEDVPKPITKPQRLDVLVPFSTLVSATQATSEEQQPLAGVTVGASTAAGAYRVATMHTLPGIKAALVDVLAVHGLHYLVYPTARVAARPLKGDTAQIETPEGLVAAQTVYSSHSLLASVTGHPCITIPCGLTKPDPAAPRGSTGSERLPVGLEILGPMHSDGMLLAFAQSVQQLQSMLPDPVVVRRWNEAVTI